MDTQTMRTAYERDEIVDLLRRYGNDTTDAVLDPASRYFVDPEIEGFLGYRLDGKQVVVYGDPVCAPENTQRLAEAFSRYCTENGYLTIYAIVSQQFEKWAVKHLVAISFVFGHRLWINPQHNPMDNTGRHGSLTRRKVKHAIKEGTEVSEYTGVNAALEESIELVGTEWLKGRRGPQVHISNVHLFEDRPGKRWFYAHKDGKVVGVVQLNQLQLRKGWLLNHLMITSDCSHGTPELLVTRALQAVAKEGCEYVTFGACPATKIDSIEGLNPVLASLARFGYQIARKVFHLDGFGEFWSKFEPQSEPIYLLFERGGISYKGIRSLLRALNVFS